MKSSLVIALMVLSSWVALGQTQPRGVVVYRQDVKVDSLLEYFESQKGEDVLVQGYRIQVASGANQSAINKVKTDFYSNFPDLRPTIIYQQPNFKLRVGYYRNKFDAYNVMMRIRESYPDAFIIRDKLDPNDINK